MQARGLSTTPPMDGVFVWAHNESMPGSENLTGYFLQGNLPSLYNLGEYIRFNKLLIVNYSVKFLLPGMEILVDNKRI